MTILNLRLAPDRADLVTDELTRDPEGRPVSLASKVMILPHLRGLLAVSGTSTLLANLGLLLNTTHCPNGIESTAELAGKLTALDGGSGAPWRGWPVR